MNEPTQFEPVLPRRFWQTLGQITLRLILSAIILLVAIAVARNMGMKLPTLKTAPPHVSRLQRDMNEHTVVGVTSDGDWNIAQCLAAGGCTGTTTTPPLMGWTAIMIGR